MAEPLRHRQTKEAATDMFSLKPPRHISTLLIRDRGGPTAHRLSRGTGKPKPPSTQLFEPGCCRTAREGRAGPARAAWARSTSVSSRGGEASDLHQRRNPEQRYACQSSQGNTRARRPALICLRRILARAREGAALAARARGWCATAPRFKQLR